MNAGIMLKDPSLKIIDNPGSVRVRYIIKEKVKKTQRPGGRKNKTFHHVRFSAGHNQYEIQIYFFT